MFQTSLRATLLLLALCCGLYPALVTGLGQLFFPHEANGSLVRDARGEIVGSALIGQAFESPRYLQGRPSAAGAGYDASASGGSNLGLTNPKLANRRATEEARLQRENPDAPGPVPEVLLAASASGLDPDLPPEAAAWQLPRIASARGVERSRLEALLHELVQDRDLGLLGEPRVNVLKFNLELDHRFPVSR